MTFDAVEKSTQGGAPVELFTFARDTLRWRYTSADRAVTVLSATFAAAAISRSEIEAGQEIGRSAITINVPRDLPIADLYRVAPPSAPITCLVQQYHEGDGEVATLWTGRILGVEFAGAAAQIRCEPIFTSIKRLGLRRMYQRTCPHVLYGSACKVNKAAQLVAGAVDSISGFVVSVSEADAEDDGHFAGGFLEFEVAASVFERRFITDHTGAALTLATSPFGLAVGMAVNLYPGCDHTLATCNAKFSNAVNYGGFAFMPTKNPFGGDPIF